MGYTTKFVGQFDISPKFNSLEIYDLLSRWNDGVDEPINGYCQWVLTEDREGLKWDGVEKFRDYEEWLQVIIDLFSANGYTLSGEVKFQGEELSDQGILKIVDNKPLIEKIKKRSVHCPHCDEDFLIEEED